MNKKPMAIYQDQRIAEEFCNFRCEYCEGFCPTGYSLRKDKDGNLFVPKEWFEQLEKLPENVKKFFKTGRSFEEFYNIAMSVIEESKNVMNVDVLKLSGGEVTVNPDLIKYVRKFSEQFSNIQILSNGLNLKEEDIKEYKKMGNVSFQISLDGVTPDSNYSKSHSATITNKVINNVELLLKNGIGVEINCVLTKYNTDKFIEFLEHFADADKLMIVPRPVRGEPRTILDFNEQQILEFENCILSNYERYSNILPPISYFYRLIEIMKTGERKFKCYLPFFIQSIDGYGKFEKCPIGLQYDEYNNILDNSVGGDSILINSDYKPDNDCKLCNYCINQYEMLNLYVDDVITADELKKMPSLDNDLIIEHIKMIKENILEKENKNEKNSGINKKRVLHSNK